MAAENSATNRWRHARRSARLPFAKLRSWWVVQSAGPSPGIPLVDLAHHWRGSDRARGPATCFFARPDRNSQFPKSHVSPAACLSPPFMPAPQVGTPATIFGVLRLPEGTGRVPAVVVPTAVRASRERRRTGAGSLVQLGIATFVVNSFAGRSIPRVCSGPHTISAASVLTDVYRARDLLAAHPRIDVTRIALMGFSLEAARLFGQAIPDSSNATVWDRRTLQPISRFIQRAVTSGSPMKIRVGRRANQDLPWQSRRSDDHQPLQGVYRQAA